MTSSDSVVIDHALAAAVRAPSPCNTQPWRFEVDGNRIDLLLDRSRVLATADPDAREARLSCGAALCNLRLAIRARDRVALVDVLPDKDRPDLLASVRIGGERAATLSEHKLADAIEHRHTNRHPFLDRPVPSLARSALASAARAEGARLEFLDASERYDLVAKLVRRAEYVQENDPAYAEEIAFWTGGPIDRPDGVPLDAGGPGSGPDELIALKAYHRPSPVPPRTFEQQPLLVAVLTPVAGPRHDIRVGAAMQRVLLTACDIGLASSFLSQPFEVPETRAELDEAFRGEGVIHTLLRVGYGYPVPMTPRRAVADVTTRR